MNKIEYTSAYTPSRIFEEKKQLNIPIYQRLFVWEEEQIELLLKDLIEASSTTSDPYYIGIITVVEKAGKWDIVDGQQRLTFLSLFGAYCCSKCSKEAKSIWQNFLFAPQESEKESENLRINYMGRPEDREDLIKIATGEGDIANRNFRVFKDCIEKKITDNKQLSNLEKFVYEKASFLITELPENYEPQDLNLFFEKMNATGKQLTAVEQIKGKYFPARAAEFDACLNFKKALDNSASNSDGKDITLKDILDNKKIEVKPEDNNSTHDVTSRSILSPEVFLLHCLEISRGQEVPRDENKNVPQDERKILDTFKKHVKSDVQDKISPDNLLDVMKKYREWLDDNIIYLKESSDGSWEYTFRSEESAEKEYEDPDQKENEDNVKLRLKMKQFQSMLYVSSSNYQVWVLKAYLASKDNNNFNLNLLKKQDNERHNFLNLDTCFNSLKEQNNERADAYPAAMKYGAVDRYWFWKLDYLLWEKFIDDKDYFSKYELTPNEKSAIRNYKFRRNRSIEHLHPQTDGDIAEWQKAKHYFGNLAMISSSFNSSQQNDSVGIKFQRLKEVQLRNNNLESIKMLLMFKLAGGQESGWTVDVMKEHQGEMFGILGVKDSSTSEGSIK